MTRHLRSPIVFLCQGMISLVLLAGCDKPTATKAPPPPPPLMETKVQTYDVRGVIEAIPEDGKTVTVNHEEIPNFMSRMTMDFAVKNPAILKGRRVGEAVTFKLLVTDDESWIEDLQVNASVKPSTTRIASLLASNASMKPGDPMPEVELLTEEGKSVKLSEFQGEAVAFTMIFTRCPLPDFCPRMNRHFQEARELLLKQKEGPKNWRFLSISFDPEFDKPEILVPYARTYRGDNADRWLFASASAEVSDTFAILFDFRSGANEGSLVHNLRTIVVDSKGRLFRQFDGNQWTPAELAEAIAKAAAR